ncbi:MAG: hypothetical protein V5B39_12165 [Accumulibacter sp.]|jgi:hypothetical protein|uniref:hypothetical protein n=1 Tax=Accumulibacter sp. TaxID=2053492 RepID=UPI002FC2871C
MTTNSNSETPASFATDSLPLASRPVGSTATGLDLLVDIITTDPGLIRRLPVADIDAGASAADQMNALIIEAIRATGVANNGDITAADLYDVNAYLRLTHLADWGVLHGNDESSSETGFHLVQNDGAKTRLYDRNAVDTVADGLYHLGFEICNGQLLNEDGNANARLTQVAGWLSSLLATDLSGSRLQNVSVDPYVDGTTHTGLDQLVSIVSSDPGLNMKISNADIRAGASAADQMNALIIEAIRATGVANNSDISAADVRDLNAYLRSHHAEQWRTLHGNDEDATETGFHLVQSDGATTRLFDKKAVDTVADGLYHLGFEICDGQLLNEDGNANVKVTQVATWLNSLLSTDLAAGTLKNASFDPYVNGHTGTGLDQLVSIITTDPGLNMKISTSEIRAGATAADAMNGLIIESIRATGAADGGVIDVNEVREMNAWIRTNHLVEWKDLHGDDEDALETGFHLVQRDGATTRLYDRNAVDTIADGLYHLGFEIEKGRVLNEDGNPNASLGAIADWLNALLQDDLASGGLLPVVAAPAGIVEVTLPGVNPDASPTFGLGHA